MSVKFKLRQRTTAIAIHCSATKPTQDIGAREIRQWHVRDNEWADIGYHYVIRRDGTIETGRPDDVLGAGIKDHNAETLHICLVGGLTAEGKAGKVFSDTFTDAQEISLFHLIAAMEEKYPDATGNVLGHRDFPRVAKDCPCFDVRKWLDEVVA